MKCKDGNAKQRNNINGNGKTGNRIGDEGVRELSEALKVNTKLATLDLWSAETWLLCQALKRHQQKDKAGNNISDEGASALSEALKANATLTTLILRCEQQQEQGNAKQKHARNSKIKAGNRIGNEGVRELCEALKVNAKLATLEMERAQPTKQKSISKQAIDDNCDAQTDNEFRSEGAIALGEALKVNTTLTTLDNSGDQQQEKDKKTNKHTASTSTISQATGQEMKEHVHLAMH